MFKQYTTPLACFKRAPVRRINSIERYLMTSAVSADEKRDGKVLTVVKNAESKLLR